MLTTSGAGSDAFWSGGSRVISTLSGATSLQIGVLTANQDGSRFYQALGGQLVGERLFDEDGDLLPELIYAWPDITTLLVDA